MQRLPGQEEQVLRLLVLQSKQPGLLVLSLTKQPRQQAMLQVWQCCPEVVARRRHRVQLGMQLAMLVGRPLHRVLRLVQ